MQLSSRPFLGARSVRRVDLVASGGLVPAVALSGRVEIGIGALGGDRLTVLGDSGANAGATVVSLVAGATSSEDLRVLRDGATDVLSGGVRAPCTRGAFLRALTFGHVRQLGAVA